MGGAADGYIETTFTVGEDEPEVPGRAKGDVVGTVSGDINVDDVFAVVQISLGVGEWEAEQITAADVVGTIVDDVNVDDVFAVVQTSLGIDVEFKD